MMRRPDITSLLLLLALLITGCRSRHEEELYLPRNYTVRFVADMNLKQADVFHQEVTSISLYVFDATETLVWQHTEREAALKAANGNYTMELTGLSDGTYHLVAWAQLEDNTSFAIAPLTVGKSKLEEMTCSINRTKIAEGADIVDYELSPLYHGMTDITLSEEDAPGTHAAEIHLTKITKDVTVVLQQLDGEKLVVEDYDFTIRAENGHINHDNSLLYDEDSFVYTAWNKQPYDADLITTGNTSTYSLRERQSYTTAQAVVAYLSIGRLVQSNERNAVRPVLSVTQISTGNTLLSIPLIDYTLMVRSRYQLQTHTAQEYLDRQDDISITLFLNGNRWVSGVIWINSWRIVLNEENYE